MRLKSNFIYGFRSNECTQFTRVTREKQMVNSWLWLAEEAKKFPSLFTWRMILQILQSFAQNSLSSSFACVFIANVASVRGKFHPIKKCNLFSDWVSRELGIITQTLKKEDFVKLRLANPSHFDSKSDRHKLLDQEWSEWYANFRASPNDILHIGSRLTSVRLRSSRNSNAGGNLNHHNSNVSRATTKCIAR